MENPLENPKMLAILARPLAMDPRFLEAGLAQAAAMGEPDAGIKTERDGDVAIVHAWGPVGKGWGFDPLELAGAVERAAAEVSAVVLNLNSPGGVVDGVPDAAARIAAVGRPVVVHTGGLLCSAAYWLASGADSITGCTSSEVGSIGVYCPMIDLVGLYEMFGAKVELAKTGALKGMGFPGTPWTDDQKAHMQQMVGDIFDDFRAAVLAWRDVPEEAMTGGAYMAKRAAGLGLLDAVGNIDEAVGLARALGSAKQRA